MNWRNVDCEVVLEIDLTSGDYLDQFEGLFKFLRVYHLGLKLNPRGILPTFPDSPEFPRLKWISFKLFFIGLSFREQTCVVEWLRTIPDTIDVNFIIGSVGCFDTFIEKLSLVPSINGIDMRQSTTSWITKWIVLRHDRVILNDVIPPHASAHIREFFHTNASSIRSLSITGISWHALQFPTNTPNLHLTTFTANSIETPYPQNLPKFLQILHKTHSTLQIFRWNESKKAQIRPKLVNLLQNLHSLTCLTLTNLNFNENPINFNFIKTMTSLRSFCLSDVNLSGCVSALLNAVGDLVLIGRFMVLNVELNDLEILELFRFQFGRVDVGCVWSFVDDRYLGLVRYAKDILDVVGSVFPHRHRKLLDYCRRSLENGAYGGEDESSDFLLSNDGLRRVKELANMEMQSLM